MKRKEYRRYEGSSVWHFQRSCRYFPDGSYQREHLDPLKRFIRSTARPKHGTLCDYCQRIERRKGR